jgi:hypothetical protein
LLLVLMVMIPPLIQLLLLGNDADGGAADGDAAVADGD